MSTPLAVTTPTSIPQPALRASFLGILLGEFLKIARLFWVLLILLITVFLVGFWFGANVPNEQSTVQHTPLFFLYVSMEGNLQVFRIFSGIVLLVLTSITIGREYQYGTIRILLARGVGRIQLLLAKLTMLFLIAVVLLLVFTLLTFLLTCLHIRVLTGNLDALHTLTPSFWSNISIDLLAIYISMGVTILMAAAMNALTRSLTVGLSASLIWFPTDNMGVLIMNTLTQVTHNTFWATVTTYFLGPLLNRLPDWMVPVSGQTGDQSFGFRPSMAVDATHALQVISVYALVFLVLAMVPTWKRDIRE